MQVGKKLTIVIQAGGRSSRMGQDKALMPFLGRPLVLRLVERLKGIAEELLVITNRAEHYQFLSLPLYQDLMPGQGPLGGLYTALSVAKQPFVAVVACDMPFVLPGLLLAQLDLLHQEKVDVVIPCSPEGLEPLHSIYNRHTCLRAVEQALAEGERRMVSWFSFVRKRVMTLEEVKAVDPDFCSFININTPEEFSQAEDLARRIDPPEG